MIKLGATGSPLLEVWRETHAHYGNDIANDIFVCITFYVLIVNFITIKKV